MIIASSMPRATNYQRLQTQKHQQLISPQNRNLMVLIRDTSGSDIYDGRLLAFNRVINGQSNQQVITRALIATRWHHW